MRCEIHFTCVMCDREFVIRAFTGKGGYRKLRKIIFNHEADCPVARKDLG